MGNKPFIQKCIAIKVCMFCDCFSLIHNEWEKSTEESIKKLHQLKFNGYKIIQHEGLCPKHINKIYGKEF